MNNLSCNARRLARICVMLSILLTAVLLGGCQHAQPAVDPRGAVEPKTPPAGETKPPPELSPITGLPIVTKGPTVAVSIDNAPEARPQSGLARADLVYEVVAEGGVTRYLAIFGSQAPETIGPVRSVRPYFAVLAKEWNAVLGHCGGSTDGLAMIKQLKVIDADDFGHGGLYWRSNARKMPHNLYGNVVTLRELAPAQTPAPKKRYDFEDWAESPTPGIEVRYDKRYAVQYLYMDNTYRRCVVDGSREPFVQTDLGTDEKIAVSNVIVQFAKTTVLDSELRVSIDLVGEGKAAYLLGGRYSEGTWKKANTSEPTWFYTSAGEKIKLTAGQTWVQIVTETGKVTELPAK